MTGEPGGGGTGPGAGGLADFMAAPAEEGLTAVAGAALENPQGRPDRDAVVEALKTVHDPEIPGQHLRSWPDLRGRTAG